MESYLLLDHAITTSPPDHFNDLLYGIADGLATERPHQRRHTGVCVGRHDMCLAL